MRRLRPGRRSGSAILLLALLLGVGLWGLLRSLPLAATRPSVGFSSYYTAGRLLLEGTSLERAWEDAWFGPQIRRFAPSVSDIWRPNPPSAALIALPVSPFSYRTARVLWTGGSILVMGLLWVWTVRRLRARGLQQAWLFVAFLHFEPFRACLWYGQVYIALAGLLAVALHAQRHDREVSDRETRWSTASGAAVGLLISLKTAMLPLGLMAIPRRAVRVRIAMAGAIVGVTLLSLAVGGLSSWRSYLEYVASPESQFTRPERSSTAYQSLLSLCSRLTAPDRQWNPAPLVQLPWLGIGAYLLVATLLCGVAVRQWARGVDRERATLRLALIHVFLSPWTLDYHYPLLWPVLVAWLSTSTNADWRRNLPAGVAFALLLLPARWYCMPVVQNGALAFLAYPKLYGALLLFALCRERTTVSCPSP